MKLEQLPCEVKTVGELAALLAILPQDRPLYRHGIMGDWVHGWILHEKTQLAKHKNDAENYTADLTDKVWKKGSKSAFHKAFSAIIIW
jgi:hypothetical protein